MREPTSTAAVTTTTLDVLTTSAVAPTTSATATATHTSSVSPLRASASMTSSTPVTLSSTAVVSLSTSSTATAAGALLPAGSAQGSSNLDTAEAVGVSVAAFGGLALIMALVWLCIRTRRRKGICRSPRSPHDSYDFIDEAPPRFSPFNYTYADPRGPLGGFNEKRAELPTDKRTQSQRSQKQPPKSEYNEKTDALGVFHGLHNSPRSNKSNETLRTISQLLPEKPGETPPRPSIKQFAPTMHSPETVFEEYRPQGLGSATMSSGRMPLQVAGGQSPKRIPPQKIPWAPSQEALKPLGLSLQPPKKVSRSVLMVPLPINISPPSSTKSSSSVLDYYVSPPGARQSLGPLGSPLTPMSFEPQRRTRPPPPTITVPKPTYPPRAVRRGSSKTSKRESGGSDTSFESTDPDEPTPPDEEDKQLSPVEEHSPISRVRYPKVPRSSNQSIPRSPPMQTLSPTYDPAPMQTLSPTYDPARSVRRVVSPREQQTQREIPRDDRAALPSRTQLQPVTPEQQTISSPSASSLRGTTLAAKRRGDSPEVNKQLVIATTNLRVAGRRPSEDQTVIFPAPTPPRTSSVKNNVGHDSPLKGYGRTTNTSQTTPTPPNTTRRPTDPRLQSPGMKSPSSGHRIVHHVIDVDGERSQQVGLESPVWEPKLTPSRRGDDLFLEVGLHSPRGFGPGVRTREVQGLVPGFGGSGKGQAGMMGA
ncbi:hypothetical protein LTR62_002663 [Meristemomyces frigidus]|uniref:Uncharacterized protein n=1 Tax=Meristemomyces frigidus TaxID=1508187 RepID=A0AAN7TK47_9PEZI|nr:hypothetical protein LTR62_002663 [Meristemomyces frigidus]